MEIFEESEFAKQMVAYRLPRYNELVKVDLLMNQLTELLDGCLSIFLVPGESKILTSSMINNYVYKNVINPPEDKKYTRIHVIHLLALSILKQVLPIPDVAELIRKQINQYPIDIAYDYFCEELEKALKVVFGNRDFADIDKTQPKQGDTALSREIRSAVLSFANQIYVKHSIYYDKILNK